jgi:carbonic anhydrase/acetyltransferase-like protein (isoleucine patch superfamily)
MPIYALGAHEPRIHRTAFVHPDAVVIGSVVIGAEATLWPGAVLRGDHGGRIEVGARTSIQDGTVLHTTQDWPTIIFGDECVVGHNTHLEGCTVEDRCLIGSGLVTLNRAVVRTGAVVGAAALIPEDFEVPSHSMALGVPARTRQARIKAEWLDFMQSYVDAGIRYTRELRRVDR